MAKYMVFSCNCMSLELSVLKIKCKKRSILKPTTLCKLKPLAVCNIGQHPVGSDVEQVFFFFLLYKSVFKKLMANKYLVMFFFSQ